jgi:hypothetical protein
MPNCDIKKIKLLSRVSPNDTMVSYYAMKAMSFIAFVPKGLWHVQSPEAALELVRHVCMRP